MNNDQNRRPNRHASRLPVISMTSPVFDTYVHQNHPRLSLQAAVSVTPGITSSFGFETLMLLCIFVSRLKEENELEEKIRQAINQLSAITELDQLVAQRIEILDSAYQKNDEYLAGKDETFKEAWRQYIRDRTALQSLKDSPRSKNPRHIRSMEEQLAAQREQLDELLLQSSKRLPYPIRIRDKPAEEAEATDIPVEIISIEELRQQLRVAEQNLANAFHAKQNDETLILPMLRDYLLEKLTSLPSEGIVKRLEGLFMNENCFIYVLEAGFGRNVDVQTDEQGFPTDAVTLPVTVATRVIQLAVETGEQIIADGSFAFVPPDSKNGLVGSIRKSGARLVIVPVETIRVILDCAVRFDKQVQRTIEENYSAAPATGAQPEQEEASEWSGRNAPSEPSAGEAIPPTRPSRPLSPTPPARETLPSIDEEGPLPSFPWKPDDDSDPDIDIHN